MFLWLQFVNYTSGNYTNKTWGIYWYFKLEYSVGELKKINILNSDIFFLNSPIQVAIKYTTIKLHARNRLLKNQQKKIIFFYINYIYVIYIYNFSYLIHALKKNTLKKFGLWGHSKLITGGKWFNFKNVLKNAWLSIFSSF